MAIINGILAHVFHCQFSEQANPDNVDIEHCAPLFGRALQERMVGTHASVINDNMDLGELGNHLLEHAGNLEEQMIARHLKN